MARKKFMSSLNTSSLNILKNMRTWWTRRNITSAEISSGKIWGRKPYILKNRFLSWAACMFGCSFHLKPNLLLFLENVNIWTVGISFPAKTGIPQKNAAHITVCNGIISQSYCLFCPKCLEQSKTFLEVQINVVWFFVQCCNCQLLLYFLSPQLATR